MKPTTTPAMPAWQDRAAMARFFNAPLVTGSRVQFRHCRLLGYQDTLHVNKGTQYFRDVLAPWKPAFAD